MKSVLLRFPLASWKLSIVFSTALLFTVLQVSAVGQANAGTPQRGVGTQFPNLDFIDESGGRHEISEFRGKGLLINFWAYYCPPCIRELPAIQRLREKLADTKEFEVLLIGTSRVISREILESRNLRFLKKKNIDLPTYTMTRPWTSEELYLVWRNTSARQPRFIPKSFLVDRDGIVRWIGGVKEWDEEEQFVRHRLSLPK